MADKKYQVFISSTFKDLKDERLDISRSVLDLGQFPAAMEYFPAIDEEQLKYIKRTIDQCDYYVLIIAGKYGSQDASGISYTEREYDYAVEKGKFVLGFPYRDITALPRNQTETDSEVITKLEKFREKVMDGRLVRQWTDRRDLDLQVTKALSTAFNEYPQPGWVRTPKDSSEELLSEINHLRKLNDELSARLGNIRPIEPVEDIAGLDETFNLEIEVLLYGDANRVKMNATWKELFLYAAASIRGKTAIVTIANGIGARLATQINGHSFTSGEVVFSYMETILVQFTVAGLIQTEDRKHYMLTEIGMKQYLNFAVVRTARS